MTQDIAVRAPSGGVNARPAPTGEAGRTCLECGLGPLPLGATQAVVAVRSVVLRFGVLFRHAGPDALRRCTDSPGSRSPSDHASHVAYDLAVLDRHLEALLGEEHREPAKPAADERETAIDALTRTGDRLARTIVGATAADWQRATTIDNRWLPDLILLTLHDAVHELHDAERALHGSPAHPEPRYPSWLANERRAADASDRPLRMR